MLEEAIFAAAIAHFVSLKDSPCASALKGFCLRDKSAAPDAAVHGFAPRAERPTQRVLLQLSLGSPQVSQSTRSYSLNEPSRKKMLCFLSTLLPALAELNTAAPSAGENTLRPIPRTISPKKGSARGEHRDKAQRRALLCSGSDRTKQLNKQSDLPTLTAPLDHVQRLPVFDRIKRHFLTDTSRDAPEDRLELRPVADAPHLDRIKNNIQRILSFPSIVSSVPSMNKPVAFTIALTRIGTKI